MTLLQTLSPRARGAAPVLLALAVLHGACHEGGQAHDDAGTSHGAADTAQDGSSSNEDETAAARDAASSQGDAGSRTSNEGGTAAAQDGSTLEAGPQVQVNPATRATLSVREPLQVCLLDAQGALACRGPGDALHVVQTGPFIDYAVNERGDGCGLGAEGALHCWGGAGNTGALCAAGEADCASSGLPPAGQSFREVAMGAQHACGVTAQGALLCWGRRGADDLTRPPSGNDFVAVESNEDVSCALTSGGDVKCWGDTFGYFRTLGPAARLTMGGDSVCAMSNLGAIDCLRWDSGALPPDRTVVYARISMSLRVLCTLTAQGKPQCFGAGSVAHVAPLPGPFVQIANSDDYACGLRADGVLQCWGDAWGNGAGAETCAVHETQLDINGTPRHFAQTSPWEGNNASYRSTGNWHFGAGFGPGNYVSIAGAGNYPGNELLGPRGLFPAESAVPVAASYWLLDASAQGSGPLTCSGTGSSVRQNGDELVLDLKKVATVSCPGRPVAGSITFCENTPCPIGAASGSIHGTPWTSQASGYSFTGDGRGEVQLADGSLLLASHEPGFDTPVDLIWGLLITTADGPFKGEVLCVGSGTLSGPTFMTSWQLGDFSVLDACPASGTGTLRGCMR